MECRPIASGLLGSASDFSPSTSDSLHDAPFFNPISDNNEPSLSDETMYESGIDEEEHVSEEQQMDVGLQQLGEEQDVKHHG